MISKTTNKYLQYDSSGTNASGSGTGTTTTVLEAIEARKADYLAKKRVTFKIDKQLTLNMTLSGAGSLALSLILCSENLNGTGDIELGYTVDSFVLKDSSSVSGWPCNLKGSVSFTVDPTKRYYWKITTIAAGSISTWSWTGGGTGNNNEVVIEG